MRAFNNIRIVAPDKTTRPVLSAPSDIANLVFAFAMDVMTLPSGSIASTLSSMLSRGIRTLLNYKNPLSIPF